MDQNQNESKMNCKIIIGENKQERRREKISISNRQSFDYFLMRWGKKKCKNVTLEDFYHTNENRNVF